MQMDLAFTKMHKTPKKTPPIVMHLDFAFYIAMHLEGETWHICQRSPAMQIEITGFSVPPRGLFSSLRAVFLRAATTSRVLLRQHRARAASPASRAPSSSTPARYAFFINAISRVLLLAAWGLGWFWRLGDWIMGLGTAVGGLGIGSWDWVLLLLGTAVGGLGVG